MKDRSSACAVTVHLKTQISCNEVEHTTGVARVVFRNQLIYISGSTFNFLFRFIRPTVSVSSRVTVKMVDEAGDRDFSNIESSVAIIREIYDGANALEKFEYALEKALESEYSLIVIEPSKLGDETSRWIAVGNCLHKTAALSGLGAIVTGLLWGDRLYICGTLGFTSVITCGLYTVSWQFDPCCQYQVETDTSKLPHVELLAVLGPSSPTFLVRKDDTRRRILHTSITLIALSISAWRVYQAFK